MSQDIESPEPPKPEPPRRPAPRLKIPVPPDLPLDDPEAGSPHRRLSTMVGVNFLLTLCSLLALGYLIYRQAPVSASGSAPATAEKPAGPDESKALAGEVDRLKSEIAGLTKTLGERPAPTDPAPQIKAIDEKVADLGKAVAEIPGKIDALAQKVEAAPKADGFVPAARVDAIEKKATDTAQAVDALKAEIAARPAAGPNPGTAPASRPVEDVNVEGQAMEQAADLFKQGKFAEAKAAFAKLQSTYPDDARVWYFSALTNGLVSRTWQGGETERLFRLGMDKEKAGSPDRAKVDAVFAGLTPANGKDWLAFYRKQTGR